MKRLKKGKMMEIKKVAEKQEIWDKEEKSSKIRGRSKEVGSKTTL